MSEPHTPDERGSSPGDHEAPADETVAASGAEQPGPAERPARLEEQLAEARAWARAEYWQRWDLRVTDPDHPPAWLMVDAPDAPEETLLEADLNAEDDDGNNWTLVEMDQFDPARVYPGARLLAGRPGFAAPAQVLRTELFLTTSGAVRVLVTFRQTALRTLEEALGSHPEPDA
ncbi:hypothetical protein [Oryzihumus leptocrescens]|nr:hypothetical protein [Oryzihumus leptocrescens]